MVLIDLNVLLDMLLERRPHFQASSAVVVRALVDGAGAFIPAYAATTIHFLVAKYGSRSSANRAVDWLLKHFQVAAVDSRVLSRARALNWSDFEDAVVGAAAEAHDCNAIITRNVNDFRDSPFSARTPEEYLLITREM